MRWPSPAPPYAPDSNALGAAMEALSAPPPDLTPEVSLAMASAAPTTGGAPPQCLRARLPICAAFTAVPAIPRASGDTSDTGALATADAPPPPDFSVSPARLTLSFAPQRSPSVGELFSGCTGASVVGRINPCFVAIRHCHLIPRLSNTHPRFVTVHPASSPFTLLRCHSPPLRCHHTPPSHHIAITVAIAIITITAVATVPPMPRPRSDRHGPQCIIMTCLHESPCSHPC